MFATNDLYLVVCANKLFGGRLKRAQPPMTLDILEDAVEFISVFNPAQMGFAIVGMRFGDIELPKEAVLAKMDKESAYWEPFYKTVTNLKAVN